MERKAQLAAEIGSLVLGHGLVGTEHHDTRERNSNDYRVLHNNSLPNFPLPPYSSVAARR
jgi:hypothetical protein